MPAPAQLTDLVARFREHLPDYHAGAYNETQLRRDFLDPFFKLLGWDVHNKAGYAEAYREVVHEDKVKVGGMTKAPDYSFRVGGQRKFFLEAKKPSIFIKEDIAPAYQLRRYAWSAGLSLSILSDFEEFAVYDCRIKPAASDKASKSRLMYFTFEEYESRWDEIVGLFSKEAILKGAFDRYAATAKGKKGTASVDAEFLKEIETWRDALARHIALRNPGLSGLELNYAVQQTIDRIIFLRICEDRGIEPYDRMQALLNGNNTYDRLKQLFRDADDRYNSGLFHFPSSHPSPSGRGAGGEGERRGHPDELTLSLKLDDKPLKEILKGLYYPNSPYEFSVLPADILGQVYEQFLGKVIRLTPGGQAKVEDKPEVKKAGGVYYTPTYIVDYIVRQTVGRLLEGKTPKQIEKIRVLDPACGSGSFLIGAYQYLLDWYLNAYASQDPEKHAKGRAPKIRQGANGWRLTTAERKRILLAHIHGVDIDPQAVEVTKLSLLLKVLEGESDDSLTSQFSLFRERVLPDLDANIQCGNSLIGSDFYDGRLDLDEDERRRINAFDWETGFPEVFKAGGFDAVIGNPPYVRPHNIPEETKQYLWKAYKTFVAKSDLYSCFMERAISLVRNGGRLSFIVPKTWTSLESFTKIRLHLLENCLVRVLTQLPKKVFQDATVETCIFVVERNEKTVTRKTNEISVEYFDIYGVTPIRKFSQSAIANFHLYNFQLFGANDNDSLFERINTIGSPLKEYVSFAYGFKTGDDEKFIHADKRTTESHAFIRSGALERYWHEPPEEYVWYVPHLMIQNRKTARPGEKERFESPKIIVSRMGKGLAATYDHGGLYVKDAMLLLANPRTSVSLLYLLGVINSNLLRHYYQHLFITIDVLKNALLHLPIRSISPDNKLDRARHDKMVKLVESMLKLHEQLAAAKTAHDKTLIQRQIDATDRQIDTLVYELYGLTEDEIRIVEAGGA